MKFISRKQNNTLSLLDLQIPHSSQAIRWDLETRGVHGDVYIYIHTTN